MDYRNAEVVLTEIAGENGYIRGDRFFDCRLKGPAVVVIKPPLTFSNNDMGPDPDAVLWELDPHRPEVVGAIAMEDCVVEGCTLVNVGIAGPPALLNQFRKDA